jgi:hypothetical protein
MSSEHGFKQRSRYGVAPFSHEKDPLVGKQPKTRQAREAKQSQREEENTWGFNHQPNHQPIASIPTQSILESTNIIGHVVVEQSTEHWIIGISK